MNPNDNSKYFLPAAVIIAGLFIAGAVYWNGANPPSGKPVAALTADMKKVNTEGNPYIGKDTAPIVIGFWSDFQCPYCRAAEVGGIPQIPTPPALPDVIKNYVDTGKVKIVFLDFAFLGPDSTTAALYGRSIWKLYPDKYFEWRTKMYEAQDEEFKGFGNAASIDALNAKIAGIDAAKVAADVKANSATYQAAIDRDRAEGQKVGVDATPSFVIGTKLLKGAYPYENVKAAIDEALK